MNSFTKCRWALCGGLLFSLSAGIAWSDTIVFDNENGDNNWNNPVNWFNNTTATNDILPGIADIALINQGNIADISVNSAFTPNDVQLSNAGGGTLNIGADLSVNNNLLIGISGQSGSATVSQTAGTVNILSNLIIGGSGATGGSDYEISGGSLTTGTMKIGDFTDGRFRILGSNPTVSVSGTAVVTDIFNGGNGTLEFMLDAAGVSPLTAQFTNNGIGATIEVNGSNYTGGAAKIPLVDVTDTDFRFENVNVSGFGEQEVQVLLEGNGDVTLYIDRMIAPGLRIAESAPTENVLISQPIGGDAPAGPRNMLIGSPPFVQSIHQVVGQTFSNADPFTLDAITFKVGLKTFEMNPGSVLTAHIIKDTDNDGIPDTAVTSQNIDLSGIAFAANQFVTFDFDAVTEAAVGVVPAGTAYGVELDFASQQVGDKQQIFFDVSRPASPSGGNYLDGGLIFANNPTSVPTYSIPSDPNNGLFNFDFHFYVQGQVVTGTPGDFDGDGDVDGRDFLIWQRGDSPNPLSAGDLAIWQAQYGSPSLVVAANTVPEPQSLLLLVCSSFAMILYKSR